MSAKKMTYSLALQEIDTIIKEIELGKVDIDELTEKLKKAKKLFEFCQKKLKTTQKSIDELLNDDVNE